jgi:RNA polymerase sigma-70 factor, ECF subfamily
MMYGALMLMAIEQPALRLEDLFSMLLESAKAMSTEFVPVVFGQERPGLMEDDWQLVRKSRNGDNDAFSQLVERYQAAISKIIWRFSRDAAVHEELVQDVFVEAFLSLGTYHGKAPLVNWLSCIATRVGYRHWTANSRNKKNQHLSPDEWKLLAGESQDANDPFAAAELLHHLLAELPPRDRLILTLRYLENCSIEEAAQRAGWSTTMTKVQCWRAMQKLTVLFERYRKETGI